MLELEELKKLLEELQDPTRLLVFLTAATGLRVRFATLNLGLVSLVSVCGRNWFYLCETVETVAECETVEITSIHAVFMHLAENMIR